MRNFSCGLIMILLLSGVFWFTFYVQPVRSDDNIFINADGSVIGTSNIVSSDNSTYFFTANIYHTIYVQRSNITIDGSGYTIQAGAGSNGFTLSSSGVTIKNTNIESCYYGIHVFSNCTIAANNITNTDFGIYSPGYSNFSSTSNNMTNNNYGIYLTSSSNHNNITGNNIAANNEYGIYLFDVSNNNITANNIASNIHGIGLFAGSHYNTIYHNDFISNNGQVDVSADSSNVWDNGYPAGGNYWSDYTGIDANSDGIGDTPVVFDELNQDNYPLMEKVEIPAIPDFVGWLILPYFILATLVGLVLRKKLEK